MDIAVDFQDAGTRLFETLRHHCPPQLYVHISLYNDFRALDRMFPLEAADKLTYLMVFADIEIHHTRRSSRRNCDNTHSNRFVNRLLSAISHLRLTHLRVVTNFAIYRPVRTAVLETDSVGHIGLGDKMDFEVTKTRFVGAVPTLQYLFLTTFGRAHAIPSKKISSESKIFTERWLTSKAWRVLHVNDENLDLWDSEVGSGSCVELSREAAERIIDRENLQLSSDEEVGHRFCQCKLQN
uniref:Adenylate cyclase n=1 Tax=Ganoderma boninense TaxID=34458 RepID=A0A5K1JTL1_9APHY|nr:Adenylate cyclase [Ganoderma boninense]